VIVWLASYPRSGNTLARILLKTVFDLPSTSVYSPVKPPDQDDEPPHSAVAAAGERRRVMLQGTGVAYGYPGTLDAFLSAARRAAAPVLVKTHDPPLDDGAAVVVVRDGRAAAVSYAHYLRQRIDGPVAMADVIAGRVGFGSWSGHLDAWQPLTRARTLLLRFEDIVGRPDAAIAALAGFLGRAPLGRWRNPNAELHAVDPFFFRGGSNDANIAELSAAELDAFWARHRGWMERLGYA
jgi:hypothetical protein